MRWLVELGGWDLFLIDVSLKASLVLVVAGGLAHVLALCRCSAATRHAVWSLALGSVLALPFLTATLPTWSIALPWQESTSLTRGLPTGESGHGPLVVAWTPTEDVSAVPIIEPRFVNPTAQVSADEVAVAAPAAATRMVPTAVTWPWFLAVWLLGVGLNLAPAFLGLISLWRLGRSSRAVASGPLVMALQESMDQLGMQCSVRLLESRERSMPMTWGLSRPTILLPEEARRWSPSRLRIVLLHELAHIQRRDCLTQLLARMARAAYWFHPLAWLAECQLRALQEQACDDLVLNSGFDGPDYAEHLLAVSAGYRSPTCAAGLALAMTRASRLERRLLFILDPGQNRRPISRRRMGVVAVAALSLLLSLCVLRFETATAGEPLAQGDKENAQPPAAAGQAASRAKALTDLRAKIAEQYVTPVDEKEIVQGAIKGMIGALHDPYSDYLTPEMVAEMEKQISGTLIGIGAQLEMHDRSIRVVTSLADSPALKAGIQPGDVILHIDGRPTAGMELTEAVKRIVGPQGTVVRLKVGRAGGQEQDITVTRNAIKVPTVKGFQRHPDNRWNFVLDAAQKIGYVQIAQFGAATPQELQVAVESLKAQGLKGLILDLRFCPGGTLESAVAAANLFLSEGTIVSLHSRNSEPTTIKADASGALVDFPLVVLVNGQTASAAEIVAGALQNNQRALVLGTRTIGKGSVQTLIKLDEGSGAIKLTTSHYRLPNGRNIDRRIGETSWGINPDEGYFVPLDQAQIKTLLEWRQSRDVIGQRTGAAASDAAEITVPWIVGQQADPQLAAALETLRARLTSGAFAKVSNLSPAQIELFLKRDDVHRRRSSVLQNLELLNRELADLEKEPS
ncbi:MAG: S41 family peptidase [Planctomycetaceae bacterium]|nr:S41 family peptidase [Planctomycetaceae bacterium]